MNRAWWTAGARAPRGGAGRPPFPWVGRNAEGDVRPRKYSVQVQAPRLPEASEDTVEPQTPSSAEETGLADAGERNPDLAAYRGRTVGLLRKYLRCALEAGRLPSVLGSEFFRTQVTSYHVGSFEDRVIFVHDMEKCVERLDEFSKRVIARVVLQEYEHEEAARLLGCTRMTVHRKLLEGLDRLSEILLEAGVLNDCSR